MNEMLRWSIRDHGLITMKFKLVKEYGHDNRTGCKGKADYPKALVCEDAREEDAAHA